MISKTDQTIKWTSQDDNIRTSRVINPHVTQEYHYDRRSESLWGNVTDSYLVSNRQSRIRKPDKKSSITIFIGKLFCADHRACVCVYVRERVCVCLC